MQQALLKRTSLINHKDSWGMHWIERVLFPFAFKKSSTIQKLLGEIIDMILLNFPINKTLLFMQMWHHLVIFFYPLCCLGSSHIHLHIWYHLIIREDHINSFTGVNNNFSNLWVSNSVGMLMLITWVGVILMEPTEFPLALPNCSESCGDVKIPYPSLWHKWRLLPENIFYQSWHLNQILETSLLQNVSIHGEMDILMSNYIDCYKHTTTRVCLWKTIWNYFSMSPLFSNIILLSLKFL